jgi:hypothetical protein
MIGIKKGTLVRCQNFNKVYNSNLLKFVADNLLHELFPACKPELLCESNLYSSDTFVRMNS